MKPRPEKETNYSQLLENNRIYGYSFMVFYLVMLLRLFIN